MLYLVEKFNMEYVFIADENLTSNRKRTIELCNLMIEKGLPSKVKWGTAGDAASVDDDISQRFAAVDGVHRLVDVL